jgi:hypothetical protein
MHRPLSWHLHVAVFVAGFSGALAGCGFAGGKPAVLPPQDAATGGNSGAAGTGNSGGAQNTDGGAGRGGNLGSAGSYVTGNGNDGGDGPTFGSNPDSNCGAMSRGAKMVPPDILIVQDRSLSMNQNADGSSCGTTCATTGKWAQMTAALNAVASLTDTTVNWGLKFFASGNSGCTVNNAPEVPVAPMSATAIASAIGGVTPGSNTPTRAAMDAAVAYMQTLTDPNPKYILLATDGMPNCPAAGGNAMTDDSPAAIASVAAAATAGFPTFIVGIGSTMADATLNSMATAGGVPQVGAATSFYQVNDTAQLETVLQTIVGSVASCTFNLGTAPNSFTSNMAIDVFGDGTKIPKDPTMTDGWNYIGTGDQIQVYGPTCDKILSGAIKEVTVTYQCIIN